MAPKTSKNPESVVKEIKRKTRRKFNPEEKIRIILEGLKGEDSISVICRREGIAPKSVLQMEQGISASWKTQAKRGYAS